MSFTGLRISQSNTGSRPTPVPPTRHQNGEESTTPQPPPRAENYKQSLDRIIKENPPFRSRAKPLDIHDLKMMHSVLEKTLVASSANEQVLETRQRRSAVTLYLKLDDTIKRMLQPRQRVTRNTAAAAPPSSPPPPKRLSEQEINRMTPQGIASYYTTIREYRKRQATKQKAKEDENIRKAAVAAEAERKRINDEAVTMAAAADVEDTTTEPEDASDEIDPVESDTMVATEPAADEPAADDV